MTRTLKVAKSQIEKVKFALPRSNYSTYQELAEDLQIARSTVSNFFNGKPVLTRNFLEISKFLNLDLEEIAELNIRGVAISSSSALLNMQSKLPPIPPGCGVVTVVLDINVEQIEKNLLAINNHLKQIAEDTSMTIKSIEPGSVVLVLSGSQEGCKQINTLFKSGQLTELLGIEILDIGIELTSFAPINLSQWWLNDFREAQQVGWQTTEDVFGSRQLAFRSGVIKRAKQINLGTDFPIALVVDLSNTADEEIDILLRVYSTGSSVELPKNLRLILLSQGEILAEVQPQNINDDYLEQPLKGSPGEEFSVKVMLGNVSITEDFVI